VVFVLRLKDLSVFHGGAYGTGSVESGVGIAYGASYCEGNVYGVTLFARFSDGNSRAIYRTRRFTSAQAFQSLVYRCLSGSQSPASFYFMFSNPGFTGHKIQGYEGQDKNHHHHPDYDQQDNSFFHLEFLYRIEYLTVRFYCTTVLFVCRDKFTARNLRV
jgi:hypothetical protein